MPSFDARRDARQHVSGSPAVRPEPVKPAERASLFNRVSGSTPVLDVVLDDVSEMSVAGSQTMGLLGPRKSLMAKSVRLLGLAKA
jgi:hypothetical protein